MNRIARAQLLPKLARLAAGLQRSPKKALLAAIVARAVCTIGVLKRNLRLGHEGTGGCGQDVTEDNGGSKGLHLHVGYHAEKIGQVTHDILVDIATRGFLLWCARALRKSAQACTPGGVLCGERGRMIEREGAHCHPTPPSARSEPHLNGFSHSLN